MNGVIYCRVSSKEQIEGTSLESQELACREYARQRDISILKLFVERGESAKFADRTQLLDLIDFCRKNQGKVQVLLVWKVDRFARNVGDHFNVKAILAKHGVGIVSVTEPIDAKPEGKLMETILAGFAQFDNDIRALRTVQGMKRKLHEGIFPWKPPLGYKIPARNSEKKTEPDEPRQPIFGLLQKAWKQFATGAYTKAEIRRLMANWGILTLRGSPLTPQSVDNLFKNPFYAGVLIDPWSGGEHDGKHIPMVSRDEFARVQQIISKRNHSLPHQKERPEFPLRGMVRCDECQAYMTASFSRGRSRRYPYYHCENAHCGSAQSYPANSVHEEFETFLGRIAPKPRLVERLGELVIEVAQERNASLRVKKTRIQSEINRLSRESQELIRMRTQGLISDREFVDQKDALAEQRLALKVAQDTDPFDPKAVNRDIDQIKEPLSELRETWQTLSPSLRRRFQRSILPVGFVNGRIGTAERALLFSAFGDSCDPKTTLVPLVRESWNRIWREIQDFAELLRSANEEPTGVSGAVPTFSRE